MTDNTQSGSDTNVTRKDTPTEVGTIKINASSLRASMVGIFVAGLYIGFIVMGML